MKIHTFKIQKQIGDREVILYPTALQIKNRNFLVDSGYEETFPDFTSALIRLGITPDKLYAILVSHDDIDHIGALKLFKEKNPGLLIYSSETEEPSISGKIKSERLEQAEKSLSGLPKEYKTLGQNFIRQLESIKRTTVDITLKDGDIIDNELQVIFTPGHTKGHISFYIPAEKTLIANDAIVIEEDNFDLANPMFTLDMAQAIKSVELIKELQPKRIICYHGGTTSHNIADKLTSLLANYK